MTTVFVALSVFAVVVLWILHVNDRRIAALTKVIDDFDSYYIVSRLCNLESGQSNLRSRIQNQVGKTLALESYVNGLKKTMEDHTENFHGIGVAIDKLEDRVTKIESNGYTFVPMISKQFSPKNFDPLTDVTYTGDVPKVTLDIPDTDEDKYWSIGELDDDKTDN